MLFHLCDIMEKTKLEGQKTVQFLLWMAGEEHKGTFLHGNVLGCSGGYLNMHLSKLVEMCI